MSYRLREGWWFISKNDKKEDDIPASREQVIDAIRFASKMNERDLQTFLRELRIVGDDHIDFVLERLYKGAPTSVAGDLVFVQKWFFRNYWGWPTTKGYEEPTGIPCNDFPMAWAEQAWSSPRLLGWREKKNGIPYTKKGEVYCGDEIISLPASLSYINSFERIGNKCYVLDPYIREGTVRVGDLELIGHPWRTDTVVCEGEGVCLLYANGQEYRLKRIPTTEVEMDGMVMEVQLESYVVKGRCYCELGPIAPRPFKRPQTHEEALAYLSKQVTFGQVHLHVAGSPEELVIHDKVQVVGQGDAVTLSYEGGSSPVYWNKVRVATSAKALIQDRFGNILLHMEGDKGWDFPGGKADYKDEPPSQIIRREVVEEIGVELPFADWKSIRRTDHSIGFLYHIIVDPSTIPLRNRAATAWFSPTELLRLPRANTVIWFDPLYRDLLRPGPVINAQTLPFAPLVLAKAGERCFSPQQERFSRKMDPAGNLVEEGLYLHSVIPGLSDPSFLDITEVDWSEIPQVLGKRTCDLVSTRWKMKLPAVIDRDDLARMKVHYLNSYFDRLRSDHPYWSLPSVDYFWFLGRINLELMGYGSLHVQTSVVPILSTALKGQLIKMANGVPRVVGD